MRLSRSATFSLFLLPIPLLTAAFFFPASLDFRYLLTASSKPPTAKSIIPRASATKRIWVSEDVYAGDNFFGGFEFFDFTDPTHGQVTYVNSSVALGKLAYVTADKKVVMTVDNFTYLAAGQPRDSVRISSKKQYNGGLFILDVEKAPWGCGVWPAFWTVGPNWPSGGEIDIVEGVHDYVHNQMTMHTAPGCVLANTTNNPFSGTVMTTTCDSSVNNNEGCAILDNSRASYGPQFNVLNGGIYAMMWTLDGINIWFFHRASIPHDITDGAPDPTGWGLPSAALSSQTCSPKKYFYNHSMVFDITFCGDWAGTSYIAAGCPGTCSQRIMDPSNFINASWSINSLQVYRDASVTGAVPGASSQLQVPATFAATFVAISFAYLWNLGVI